MTSEELNDIIKNVDFIIKEGDHYPDFVFAGREPLHWSATYKCPNCNQVSKTCWRDTVHFQGSFEIASLTCVQCHGVMYVFLVALEESNLYKLLGGRPRRSWQKGGLAWEGPNSWRNRIFGNRIDPDETQLEKIIKKLRKPS